MGLGMGERMMCGKCGRNTAWIERDSGGLVQRCMCGATRPVIKKAEGNITVLHSTVRRSEVVLPQMGTKTRKCLTSVANAWPKERNTSEVAQDAGLQNKETASLLMTLMAKGLVERVSERRGLLGGSEWRVTVPTRELLNL